MTIFRVLFGAVLFGILVLWGGSVLIERDRCKQIEKATAPVRVVMDGLRALDSQLNVMGSRLDWIMWRVKADEGAQNILISVFYGDQLVCKPSKKKEPIQFDLETRPDVELRGPNPFFRG